MIARILCAAVGVCFVLCECWGVFDFLHDQRHGIDYMVALGVLLALVAPALPWATVKAWRVGLWPISILALAVLPAAVTLVLISGVNRMGSAADSADAAITKANRNSGLAAEVKSHASDALDAATAAMREECAGKGQKGDKCKKERANVETAQGRYDAAVAELSTAPTQQGNALTRRVHQLVPAVSEDQVALYVPVAWPFVAFLVGTIFLSVGLHSPKVAESNYQVILDSSPPKTADVASFALKALTAAPGASVESKRLFPVYCAHAAKNGLSALPRELFELELATLWKEAGLEVQPVRNGIKVLGVKLAA